MATNDFILICGFTLLLLAILLRPNQVVVVRERNAPPGCIGSLLGILFLLVAVIIGFILLETSTDSSPPSTPEKKGKSREQVNEGARPLINQAPSVREREITQRDTLVNMAPPRSPAPVFSQNETMPPSSSEDGSNREIYMPKDKKQNVVLVKRFADLEQALQLRKHFSRWGMEVFEIPSDADRYWNCVLVSSPEEGYAKIRAWNRHHRDFDHLDLELTVTHLFIH